MLDTAHNSNDPQVLKELASNVSSKIRRIVARNHNTPTEILNKLANDAVQNVSFMALQNPNCTINRDTSFMTHPCVVCEKDDRYMDCHNCNF